MNKWLMWMVCGIGGFIIGVGIEKITKQECVTGIMVSLIGGLIIFVAIYAFYATQEINKK